MKTVSVYGDSLLKGVSLVGNRYTVCTRKMAAFAEAHGIELLNRSYFGATVEKGLWRLNRDIADKTPLGEYTVLEFGGNDCDFDWAAVAADPEGEHVCKVPPERFSHLLQSAVEAVRAAGGRPLLTTLPPSFSTSFAAASALPPVAIRSSTITTRSPGLTKVSPPRGSNRACSAALHRSCS